jgi:hypothetical protein
MRPLKRARTLLGKSRRKRILRTLPRGAVAAEIGVFRGEFTDHILRITRPRELHLIDGWWKIYGERFPDWGPYTDGGRLRTRDAYQQAREVVRSRSAEDVCTFHVGDDVPLFRRFPDSYFDWVYLDTSHDYQHTLEELTILDRKVKPSGLIVGDDWQEDPGHRHHGVCRAVREFCGDSQWELRRVQARQWCIARSRPR